MDNEKATGALVPTDHVVIVHHGADLEGYAVGSDWYIAMRRVCRSLGLDWEGQRQRIMRDPILHTGAALIVTETAGGAQESLGLRLDLFWGWLFKIDLGRIDPEIRPWIEGMQREGYQVLAAHFTARMQGAPAASPNATLDAMAGQLREMNATLTQLRAQQAQALAARPRRLPGPRHPLAPEAVAILAILRGSDVALSPAHIERVLAADGTVYSGNYVRVRCMRLARAGYVEHVGRGLYQAVDMEAAQA